MWIRDVSRFFLETGWRHSGIRIRISATAKRPLDEDAPPLAKRCLAHDYGDRGLEPATKQGISQISGLCCSVTRHSSEASAAYFEQCKHQQSATWAMSALGWNCEETAAR
jgi:hypothetical protein